MNYKIVSLITLCFYFIFSVSHTFVVQPQGYKAQNIKSQNQIQNRNLQAILINPLQQVQNPSQCPQAKWAFAITKFYQDLLKAENPFLTNINLSQQYLLQCAGTYTTLCHQGSGLEALRLALSTGIPEEALYPYSPFKAYNNICSSSVRKIKLKSLKSSTLFTFVKLPVAKQYIQNLINNVPLVFFDPYNITNSPIYTNDQIKTSIQNPQQQQNEQLNLRLFNFDTDLNEAISKSYKLAIINKQYGYVLPYVQQRQLTQLVMYDYFLTHVLFSWNNMDNFDIQFN